jgi:hypothetical protein
MHLIVNKILRIVIPGYGTLLLNFPTTVFQFLDKWGLQDASRNIISIQTLISAWTTKEVKKTSQRGLEIV